MSAEHESLSAHGDSGQVVPAGGLFLRWWLATRPRTLTASIVPVLVGSAVAWQLGAFDASVAAVCLLAALMLQVGTNLANDALDFAHGVDTEDRIGPTRVTQGGLLSYRAVIRGTAIAFGVAVGCGAYLIAVGGWPILIVGLVAIAAGIGYSGGPFPLSKHGLGELAAFLFFGVVAVSGTTYLHVHALADRALLASVPVGALVTALMVVNNLRDIGSDAAVGKRTLAVRIGAARTRGLFVLLVGLAFVWSGVLVATGSGPGVLLVWGAAPLALPLVRELRVARDGTGFNAALAHTARLHALFGVLLAVGYVV